MNKSKIIMLFLEQFWETIEICICYFPGIIGRKLRYLYWKIRLQELGKDVRFGIGIKINNPGYISIGNNCWIDNFVQIDAGPINGKNNNIYRKSNPDFFVTEGEIKIGDSVHIAPFVILQGHSGIIIGNKLTIAAGSKLYSLVHHYENKLADSESMYIYKFVGLVPPNEQALFCSPIVIHDNAAVGLNSVILPGSIIGKNSWLGAQSLLKGVLPEDIIAYGNPARIIKKRFTQ